MARFYESLAFYFQRSAFSAIPVKRVLDGAGVFCGDKIPFGVKRNIAHIKFAIEIVDVGGKISVHGKFLFQSGHGPFPKFHQFIPFRVNVRQSFFAVKRVCMMSERFKILPILQGIDIGYESGVVMKLGGELGVQ